ATDHCGEKTCRSKRREIVPSVILEISSAGAYNPSCGGGFWRSSPRTGEAGLLCGAPSLAFAAFVSHIATMRSVRIRGLMTFPSCRAAHSQCDVPIWLFLIAGTSPDEPARRNT